MEFLPSRSPRNSDLNASFAFATSTVNAAKSPATSSLSQRSVVSENGVARSINRKMNRLRRMVGLGRQSSLGDVLERTEEDATLQTRRLTNVRRLKSADTDEFFDAFDQEVDEDGVPIPSKNEQTCIPVTPGFGDVEVSQAKLDALANYVGMNPILPNDFFRCPPMDHIQLRGKSYMSDRVKVKASRSLLRLVAVDLYSSGSRRVDHVASLPNNRLKLTQPNQSRPSFTYVVNLQLPGSPSNFGLCFYLCPSTPAVASILDSRVSLEEALRIGEEENIPQGLVKLIRDFFLGDDDQMRSDRFKMIPYIRDGPWVVRNAVPCKPALIGRRLPVRSFRGDGYLEIDVDIGGGRRLAKSTTQLAVGYSSMLTFDVAFLVEGRDVEELPEEILGIASIREVDCTKQSFDLGAIIAELDAQEHQSKTCEA